MKTRQHDAFKARWFIGTVAALGWMTLAAQAQLPEISKSLATATLAQGSSKSGYTPAMTIDGNTGNFWEGAGGFPYCLRYDFGAEGRKRFVGFDFYPYHNFTFNDWEVYVTDSESSNPADWGTPLATGTVPVPPPGLSLPDEVIRLRFEPPVNGRFLMLRMLNGNTRSLVREVWFYGADAGPFFLADPVKLDLYVGSTRPLAFSVGDPEGTLIKADLAIADATGVLSDAAVDDVDVLGGGTDVFSFNAASGWAAAEGPLSLTASAITGAATVTVTESSSEGYTPQDVLTCTVTVSINSRAIQLSQPALVLLGTNDTVELTISVPAPAPGAISVTPGTPSGASASFTIDGDLDIADGATVATGLIRITASAGTHGVSTLSLTAGNGFLWPATGTDTLVIRASVLPNGVIHVASTGSDTTGDGSSANPVRTLTHAIVSTSTLSEIQMGVGAYRPTDGEAFPITIPVGFTVTGVRGSGGNESDSTVLNPGGLTEALALATTPTGQSGFVGSLVVSNFLGGAINATGWRGQIDNVLITEAVAGPATAAVLYHLSGQSNLRLTRSVARNIINTETANIINFVGGSGPVTIEDCVFENITVRRTSLGNHVGVIYFNGVDVTIRDSVFDTLVCSSTSAAYAGGFFHFRDKAYLFKRNTVRNISETGLILCGNSAGTSTVRNSLFYNLNAKDWGVVGGYNTTYNVYNCTFDSVSAVFHSNNASKWGYFYNCSISNSDTTNPFATSTRMQLHHVNVYNTPLQNTDEANNTAITDFPPYYRDRAAENYRLMRYSPLVDLGNNTHVIGTNTNDLDRVTRILDGTGDGTATVDLGAYEVNTTAPAVATFVAEKNVYAMIAGTSLAIPVRIIPPVSGGPSVTANVTYGDDVSGPATLVIPDGEGPAMLNVMAASEIDVPGALSVISLTEQTGEGVQSGEFGVRIYGNEVTVNLPERLFLRAGVTNEVRVSLVAVGATAPARIGITPGTAGGPGSNQFAWRGNAYIEEGEAQSDGYLEIVAGDGINTFALTVGGGFDFRETGSDTVVIEIIGYPGSVFVDSAHGSDTANSGAQTSPLQTIGYAVEVLQPGETIRLLPGTYSADTEDLPLFPGGVHLVGHTGDPADVIMRSDGANVSVLRSLNTSPGLDGYVANVTFTATGRHAVEVNNATLVVSNCVFTAIAAGGNPAAMRIVNNGHAVAYDTRFQNLSGTAVIRTEIDGVNNMSFTGHRCHFIDNTTTLSAFSNGRSGSEPSGVFTVNDCYFRNNAVSVPGSDAWPNGATIVGFAGGTFTMNRCIVDGGNAAGGWMFNLVRMTATIRDSLFINHFPSYGMVKGYGHTLSFVNCTFVHNKGGFNAWNATAWLRNCIIAHNDSLNFEDAARVGLTDCIVWDTPLGGGYHTSSVNIIEADPLFVARPVPFDAATANLQVRSASPAIDAGNNAHVTTAFDLVGTPRILDGLGNGTAVVDIGAYERIYTPPGSVILVR